MIRAINKSADLVVDASATLIAQLEGDLRKAEAEKTVLVCNNDRLQERLFKKSLDWKKERKETLKLENEAERSKLRSGETPIESVAIDPLEQLLIGATTEGERVKFWEEAVQGLDRALPEKAFVQALELAATYRLRPNTQIGKKGDPRRGSLLSTLKFELERATGDSVIEVGIDGLPILTELGKFFVEEFQKKFGDAAFSTPIQNETTDKKPDWEIPSSSVSGPASELFDLVAGRSSPTVFAQGQVLLECLSDRKGKVELSQITPIRMISLVEEYVRPYSWKGNPPSKVYSRLTKPDVEPLLEIPTETAKLPHLAVLANAPVLIEPTCGSAEILTPGYNRGSGIYVVHGDAIKGIAVDDAVKFILELYSEFSFASDGDLSRAIAATITPALVLGGTLGGRPAVDVAEADQSQAGKGYRQRIIAAIYNETFANVVDKASNGGVGSLDESFDSALVKGNHFIRIDNFRGELRSQKIESFLTEDTYAARAPFQRAQTIDPSRRLLFITSNGMEMTKDLANRSCICRIRKQRDRDFRDTLAFVREQQSYALGCVLSICKAWIEQGKPHTKEKRHDFRFWVQALDWIVQDIFELPPLMDGHQVVQERMSSPYLVWLRAVAIAIVTGRRCNGEVTASDIVQTCFESEIEIPNVKHGDEKDAARGVGRIMSKIFNGVNSVTVDGFHVKREEVAATDEIHHDMKVYEFTKAR